ncbi:MAG: YkvA family protein [Desulfurobacteriaceae bacterium]
MDERKKRKAQRKFAEQIKKVKSEDVEKVLKKREEIEKKLKGQLMKFIYEIKLLFELLSDFKSGKYKEVPWHTIAAIVAALLYVLNPLDVIPDFIPVVGQIDDAFVLGLCLTLIEKDLNKYKVWREEQKKEKTS